MNFEFYHWSLIIQTINHVPQFCVFFYHIFYIFGICFFDPCVSCFWSPCCSCSYWGMCCPCCCRGSQCCCLRHQSYRPCCCSFNGCWWCPSCGWWLRCRSASGHSSCSGRPIGNELLFLGNTYLSCICDTEKGQIKINFSGVIKFIL